VDRGRRGGISARQSSTGRSPKVIARNASPAVERPAKLLTWAADEHLLLAVSAGPWLASRGGDERERMQADHVVISVVATAILPHLLKRLFAQERPDGGVASALGQSPRCLSLRPCHARRRSRFCHLLGMSKVSAPGMGSWQLGCCNPDRSAGVLDDGCSRRPCDVGAFAERCVRPLSWPGAANWARPSSNPEADAASPRCATAQKAGRLRSGRPSGAEAGDQDRPGQREQ
jgi:hypothetical protein